MTYEFCEHIIDLLSDWGEVSSRAMFGGYGLYRNALIFAIIADETLYFKADTQNGQEFEKRGAEPFTYEAKGKRVALRYWSVPADVLEDPKQLSWWAEQGYQAAIRAQKPMKR